MQLNELRGLSGDVDKTIKSSGKSDMLTTKNVVEDDPIDIQRRESVKEAMAHAWASYEKYAWGQDELQVCFLIFQ